VTYFLTGETKTMSRKAMGDRAMTAAERQRKRRAKLRAEHPPRKPGRPRADTFNFDIFDGHPPKTRRAAIANMYAVWGEFVLRTNKGAEDYSKEDEERFKPLYNTRILEQIGRYARYLYRIGWHKEAAKIETRELAAELLKQGELDHQDVVDFFRWARDYQPVEPFLEKNTEGA
jgi:hypothetical protein